MTGFDANEHLTPFRDARGYGAILFDRTQLRQPDPAWFSPQHWGEAAQPVAEGGRGGAWFIQTGEGDAVRGRGHRDNKPERLPVVHGQWVH